MLIPFAFWRTSGGGGGGSVPVVSAVSYGVVSTAGGGARVVVTVDSSTGCTGITAGAVAFTSFAIDDATHVSGTPGAHAAGVVDVVVTNATGPSTTGTGLIEYWHPTQLSPKVRASAGGYVVGTWTDTGSLANNLVQATGSLQPAVGSTLGGFSTVDFDGADDVLANTTPWNTLLTGVNVFMWCLFNADAATARGTYDGNLVGDAGNAEIGLGFSTSGIGFTVLDSSVTYQQSPAVACATGGWHLALGMVDSSDAGAQGKIALDGSAWSTFVASGGYVAIAPGNVSLGRDYSTACFDGREADVGVVQGIVSAANVVRLRSYMNQRYGVAV